MFKTQVEQPGLETAGSGQFSVGILLPCSSDFRCFPAGSGDFPASFLQNPARSGGRNHRRGIFKIYLQIYVTFQILV
jgi:hypothetical protein